MPIDNEFLFEWSSNLALIGWLLLLLSPIRWRWLLGITGIVIPALLGVLYGGLMMTHFMDVEGGGYGSIPQIKALFENESVLLAGWIHYLAFDLAIGSIIAQRADAAGLSRLIQTPILLCTFLFGPFGFLLFALTNTGWKIIGGTREGASA